MSLAERVATHPTMERDFAGQQDGASGSDFVRKLYRMLQSGQFSNVIRWGDAGDSFVVLENEKFTKNVLPKNFKHSNFASFVRQLNKYDFHKVRQSGEEPGTGHYGSGSWEFKHPEFRRGDEESLDRIKRKAPAARKAMQVNPEEVLQPGAQVDMMNNQLVAMQHQIQSLSDSYQLLIKQHKMVIHECIGLQKTVKTHETVMQTLTNYLNSSDSARSATTTNGFEASPGAHSPLTNVQRLLNSSSEALASTPGLDEMYKMIKLTNGIVSTPESSTPNSVAHGVDMTTGLGMGYGSMSNDFGDMVYPAGHVNGIDPASVDYAQSIPFPMPINLDDPNQVIVAPPPPRKKNAALVTRWIRAPSILLVEDDPTCRRIGGKFLNSFGAIVENAHDGYEAVTKCSNGKKYDLILMDIIMPNLDGVSAANSIRTFDDSPIVAMTSNIRSDDIALYCNHGMNDVLPKPFTKEGLLKVLETHLEHLCSSPPMPQALVGRAVGGAVLKEESSPLKSPASSWNSPGGLTGVSPSTVGMNEDPYLSAASMRPPSLPGNDSVSTAPPPQPLLKSAYPSTPDSLQRGHRRSASEMHTGADDSSIDPKRQRVYIQPNQMAAPFVPMQRR